jgi:chromosome segregation ATPase
VNTRNSAVFVPGPGVAKAATPEAGSAVAAKAGEPGKDPADPGSVEMFKLKHQIKTVRLSLADTQGRLVVTEKDLAAASNENVQLRSDTTNLRVGLAKAETIAKKSEEELGVRRQEVQAMQTARPSGAGSATMVLVLLLCLVITGMVAAVLFGQGSKLRTILERTQHVQADGGRVEQLRAQLDEERQRLQADEGRVEQLRAQLDEERQRSQRFEQESQQLKAAVESQAKEIQAKESQSSAPAPAGSKREKLERMRRELQQTQAAVEAEKRRADQRIQKLEAEMARIISDKQDADERLQKLEPEMARLAGAKQELYEQVQKLEPEVTRLASDKQEAEENGRRLAHDAARLMAEKLRLEHALSKANEKLAFFGHDEPEDTLPPIVG